MPWLWLTCLSVLSLTWLCYRKFLDSVTFTEEHILSLSSFPKISGVGDINAHFHQWFHLLLINLMNHLSLLFTQWPRLVSAAPYPYSTELWSDVQHSWLFFTSNPFVYTGKLLYLQGSLITDISITCLTASAWPLDPPVQGSLWHF